MKIIEVLLWIVDILCWGYVAFAAYLAICEFFTGHQRAQEAYEEHGWDIDKINGIGILLLIVAFSISVILAFVF